MARTTLDIDERLLEDAMQISGVKSKTETIELALRELIRRHRREMLRSRLGTFELDLDLDELERLRQEG